MPPLISIDYHFLQESTSGQTTLHLALSGKRSQDIGVIQTAIEISNRILSGTTLGVTQVAAHRRPDFWENPDPFILINSFPNVYRAAQ